MLSKWLECILMPNFAANIDLENKLARIFRTI